MLKLRNMEEFSLEIEKLVTEKHLTYLDAVIVHLSTCGIEYDSAKVRSLLSPKIQQKIFDEASEYNMLGKGTKTKKITLD